MQWDARKLDEHFIPDDSDSIKNIPLATCLGVNSLFWFYDDRGAYSIRSGYWLACNFSGGNSASTSSGFGFWDKVIWKLNIPNKVKHFL